MTLTMSEASYCDQDFQAPHGPNSQGVEGLKK